MERIYPNWTAHPAGKPTQLRPPNVFSQINLRPASIPEDFLFGIIWLDQYGKTVLG